MGYQEFKETKNSWETLGIMQHYGIPTRLLDWSKSLINALFFCLSDCIDCKIKCHLNEGKSKRLCAKRGNPVIWILDPEELHKQLYPELHIASFTVGIDDDKLKDYKDEFIMKEGGNWPYKTGPIFLEIPWNNPRIRQQKGSFTFHYNNKLLEKICPAAIKCVEIDPKWKKEILTEFEVMCINEYDIYTDLVSLSRYMRRIYEL